MVDLIILLFLFFKGIYEVFCILFYYYIRKFLFYIFLNYS